MEKADTKYSIQLHLLSANLKPFLAALYKSAIEQATVGLHTDSLELLDKALSVLVEPNGYIDHVELVGFVVAQAASLAAAASAVCEAWEQDKSVPFHRVMVYSKRYIKVDTSPVFYDMLTNTELPISAKHAPIESTNYPLGAIYARIISQRNERKV